MHANLYTTDINIYISTKKSYNVDGKIGKILIKYITNEIGYKASSQSTNRE